MWSEGRKFFRHAPKRWGLVFVFNAKLTECFSEMKQPCEAWAGNGRKNPYRFT